MIILEIRSFHTKPKHMKKIREYLRDFFEDNNILTAVLIIAVAGYVLHITGIVAWDHKFVDEFWKNKHL
jgi:hypothetical protein